MAHPPQSLSIGTAPASFQDWPELLRLLQDCFAFMESRINPPSSLHTLGAAELRAKAAKETLLIDTDNTGLVGCAYAEVRPNCVYLGKVAVAPRARGQGLARRFVELAQDLARQHGRAVLELQVRIELTENQATFAALGFKSVAHTAHAGFARPTSVTMHKAVAPD